MSVQTISANVIGKIETLSKKFNIGFDEVMSIYNKYAVAGNNEKVSLLKTIADVETEYGNIKSNAPTLYAYVLNDFGPSDIFELMRGKATRMYENPQTQQKAIDEGYVNYEGIPLDYRTKLFGKPNEQYGEPLTGSLWQRSIMAIVSQDDVFTTPMIVDLAASDEFAKELPLVEAGKIYQFRGNINPKYPSKINISAGTKFKEVTNAKISAADIANKIPTVDLKDAEIEYSANFAGKANGKYLAAVKGSVLTLDLNPIKGNRTFYLIDEALDTQMRCKISENTSIRFSQADDVIVFCKLFPGRDGKIGAQVRAYMVVA